MADIFWSEYEIDHLIKNKIKLVTTRGVPVLFVYRINKKDIPNIDVENYPILALLELKRNVHSDEVECLPLQYSVKGKARSTSYDDIIGFHSEKILTLEVGKRYLLKNDQVVTITNISDDEVTGMLSEGNNIKYPCRFVNTASTKNTTPIKEVL